MCAFLIDRVRERLSKKPKESEEFKTSHVFERLEKMALEGIK